MLFFVLAHRHTTGNVLLISSVIMWLLFYFELLSTHTLQQHYTYIYANNILRSIFQNKNVCRKTYILILSFHEYMCCSIMVLVNMNLYMYTLYCKQIY